MGAREQAIQGMERQAQHSLPLVITASSVGTMIEWYDFYIFGSLAAVLSLKFYPPGNDTFAYIAYLATFAVGFLVRAVRCDFLRPHRRSDWTKVRVSRDAIRHGRRDSPHRVDANI